MSMKMVSTIMQMAMVVRRSMPIEYPNAMQAARPNMIPMAVIPMKIWESSGKKSSSAPSQKAYMNARTMPSSSRRPSELVRRVVFSCFFFCEFGLGAGCFVFSLGIFPGSPVFYCTMVSKLALKCKDFPQTAASLREGRFGCNLGGDLVQCRGEYLTNRGVYYWQEM